MRANIVNSVQFPKSEFTNRCLSRISAFLAKNVITGGNNINTNYQNFLTLMWQ